MKRSFWGASINNTLTKPVFKRYQLVIYRSRHYTIVNTFFQIDNNIIENTEKTLYYVSTSMNSFKPFIKPAIL